MGSGPSVAVIGGGIIGLSIAWRLAQSGASVTVFEAGRIGSESSWAGAGMLAPGGEYDSRTQWTELAIESLAVYKDFVEELEQESRVSIDFRVCGAFEIAFLEDEAIELRARAERQSPIGIHSEQFAPSRIPGLRTGAIAAQYYPGDAVVNPRDVVRALHLSCKRAGVTVREFEGVRHIPGLPFECVVVAAGAWSGQIHMAANGFSEALPASLPIRGHLIAFEEHTGLCDAIVRHDSTYLLRRSGNLVIAGASTERVGFDRTLDGAIAEELASRAAGLIPDLAGRRYMAWNGFRPGSETGDPVIGRLENSTVWLAYGHYRNGILLAPATARRIAREITSASLTRASWQTDSPLIGAHPQ